MTERKTRVISNLLSLILGVAVGAGCYGIAEKITLGQVGAVQLEAAQEAGGAVIKVREERGMVLTSAKLPSSEYDANGLSAQAESVYTLTASVVPSEAGNQEVDWEVEWSDPSSAWASGKAVTDYVSVVPTSDGSLTANAGCIKSFGEQAVIRVRSRDNPAATATCTVDYAKKITGISSLTFAGTDKITPTNRTITIEHSTLTNGYFVMSYDMDFTVTWIRPTFEYSEYTIDDAFTNRYAIASTAQWIQTLKTAFQNTLNISDTISSTPEYVFEGDRGSLFLGRYAGLNVLTGVEVSSKVTTMRNSGSATNTYLGALNTYNAGYSSYPLLYFYVKSTGSYSDFSAYYYLKLDTSTASASVESVALNESGMTF